MPSQAEPLPSGRIGKRHESRLRVRLGATVTTHDATVRVLLNDLSTRGARVSGGKGFRIGQQAVVQWGKFEGFGEVRWVEGDKCGIEFYDPITVRELLSTRELDNFQRLPGDDELLRRAADGFVRGNIKF